MAYGCRHNDSVVLNRYDLGGVLNVLANRVGDFRPAADLDEQSYFAGAFNALYVLESHEWRDQVEFFAIFDGLRDVAMGPEAEVDGEQD